MDGARKNVIITGANRGIGYAMVKAFAENGYDVWACARAQTPEFEEEMQRLSDAAQAQIRPVYFDLSKEEQIKEGMKKILSGKNSIDVLINNAGVAYGGLLMMTSVSAMREVYEVNVFAQVLITQMVSKRMMRQKSGCIINMCSMGGIDHNPGYLAYGSSKASMIWITKCLARELGQFGIRVNGIAPGLVDTEMGNYNLDEKKDKIFPKVVIKRMGEPEEIAKGALYIASEDAAYMTGHIMVLDGGCTA